MQKDWIRFYGEGLAPTHPSPFAEFVMSLSLPGDTLVDLGCGNGRDTRMLGTRYRAVGIDPNFIPDRGAEFSFVRSSWKSEEALISAADVVYSRFFLHSIPQEDVSAIIGLARGYFCAEARAVGDDPKIYPDHARNFVDGNELLVRLIAAGFEIAHYGLGRGLAPYGDEDPLIVRVIAKKK